MRLALRVLLVVVAPALFVATRPQAASQPDPMIERWRQAWASLGLTAPEQEWTGRVAADRWFDQPNWFPVDGTRRALCGRVEENWTLYDGFPATPSELDLHAYIVPGADYEHMLTELPVAAFNNLHLCGKDAKKCIWGEVTVPDPASKFLFGEGALAGKYAPYTGYVNGAACAYGPFVMEKVHGWRPEIHPMERFWGQSENNSLDLWLFQDSSERFSRPSDFVELLNGPLETWSKRSLKPRMGIAFETAPGSAPSLRITKLYAYPDRPDPSPRPVRTLDIDGTTLTVERPSWIAVDGVSFHRVTTEAGPRLRGLVWISTNVAAAAQGKREDGSAVHLRIDRAGFTSLPPLHGILPRPGALTAPPEVARGKVAAAPGASVADDLVLRLDIMEIEANSFSEPFREKLPQTDLEWELRDEAEAAKVREWRVPHTQWLHGKISFYAKVPAAERRAAELNTALQNGDASRLGAISIDWSFKRDGLDNHAGIGGQATADDVDSRSNFAIWGVRRHAGPLIERAPASSGLGKTRSLAHTPRFNALESAAWKRIKGSVVQLRVQTPGRAYRSPVYSSALTATAEIRASLPDGTVVRSEPFKHVFFSHMPVFSGGGWRVEPRESFMTLVANYIKRRRPQAPAHGEIARALLNDWTRRDEPLAPATRRARVFYYRYLAATTDSDIGSLELMDLLNLAYNYSLVKWP